MILKVSSLTLFRKDFSVSTHLGLGVPVVQNHKFLRYHRRLLISRPYIYWFYQGHLGRETGLLSTRVTNADPSSMITSSSSSRLTHGRKRLPTPPWNIRKSFMKTSQLRRKLGSTRFSGSSSSRDLSLGSFKENQREHRGTVIKQKACTPFHSFTPRA